MTTEATSPKADAPTTSAPEVTRRLIGAFAATAPERPADGHLETLTPRERDVLLLMARGLSNAGIATELVLEASTVKKHVANVLPAKPRLTSRAHAVVFAYEHGLARPAGDPSSVTGAPRRGACDDGA